MTVIWNWTRWIHPSNKHSWFSLSYYSSRNCHRSWCGYNSHIICRCLKGTALTVPRVDWRPRWESSSWTRTRMSWPSSAKMARWVFSAIWSTFQSQWWDSDQQCQQYSPHSALGPSLWWRSPKMPRWRRSLLEGNRRRGRVSCQLRLKKFSSAI